MRRWNKVIFLGVTCLALAGCGKNRGDELAKDCQKNDVQAGDVSAETDSVTGHLEYELVSDSEITFTVDADVTGGDRLAESCCYGAKPVEVNETYLKEQVSTVFDEGTAKLVKPYPMCSQEELAERQRELQQKQQEFQTQADSEKSTINEIWTKGLEADLAANTLAGDQQDEEIVQKGTGKYLYTAKKTDGSTTSLARIDGEISGVPYVYEWADYNDKSSNAYSITRYVRYDMISEGTYSGITVRPKTETDQVEGLDLRDAESRAYDFLVKLGYGDFSCFETGIGSKLGENTDSTSMSASLNDNWYCFSYTRAKDGIPAAGTSGVLDFTFGIADGLSTPDEVITVAVDADGVAVVNIQSAQYQVDENGTKIETFLSMEQVDAAAQKYMQEFKKTDAYASVRKMTVDRVKLNYVYVHYTNGMYNVIPVWAYYGFTGDDGKERYLFGVSAVDGQIVEGQYLYYMDATFVI